MTHPRTKEKMKVSLEEFEIPANMRCNPKVQAQCDVISRFAQFSFAIGFM
jgi:hypothetical protein